MSEFQLCLRISDILISAAAFMYLSFTTPVCPGKYGNPVYMCPSLLINSFIIFIMIVVAYYYTDKELTRWTPTKLSYSSLNTNLKAVLSLPLACSVFSRRSARRKQRRFSQLVIIKQIQVVYPHWYLQIKVVITEHYINANSYIFLPIREVPLSPLQVRVQ